MSETYYDVDKLRELLVRELYLAGYVTSVDVVHSTTTTYPSDRTERMFKIQVHNKRGMDLGIIRVWASGVQLHLVKDEHLSNQIRLWIIE
jgi:hypothetical protein